MPDPSGLLGGGGATRIVGPENILSHSPFEGYITATLNLNRLKLLRGLVEDAKSNGLQEPYRRTLTGLSSGLRFHNFNGIPIARKPELYKPLVMSEEELTDYQTNKSK